jgi:hypothetical protein
MSKTLLTRNECRKIGLNYANTSFQRWEKDNLLTPHKPGGRRSARVHYYEDEVLAFIGSRPQR